MLAFIATLQVASGREAEFEKLQTELSEISHREEDGLLVYDVLRHKEKSGTYVVSARFRDQAAFDFHQEADQGETSVIHIEPCDLPSA